MRALLPIATVVIALTPVVHAGPFGWFSKQPRNVYPDAGVYLEPYDTLDCSGEPQQAPHKLIHYMCTNFLEAGSMKPKFWKGHHTDWIDKVNNKHMQCKLQTYSQHHCPENNRTVKYRNEATDEQPKNLNKCLVPTRKKYEDDAGINKDFSGGDAYARLHAIRSAVLVCGPVENPDQGATDTGTLLATPHTKKGAQQTKAKDARQAKIAARGAAVEAAGESKGVWMKHPWTLSMLCFSCYTKEAQDYRKIECRGGDRYPADCGPKPTAQGDNIQSTVTSTVTAVSTTHTTRTKKSIAFERTTSTVTGVWSGENSDEEFPDLEIKLHEKRSWHTPVYFSHPFLPGKLACADAEWEKRGQGSKSYVKIQHVHICGHRDRPDSRWLGFVSTVIHTATSTKTASHTSTSTSTAFIARTTKMVPKHDQL